MTDVLDNIIAGNRHYRHQTLTHNPTFFDTLKQGQSPQILWIGCADSRIPETTICASQPGELFVHRNIANCVHAGDINAASVVEYAVAHLKVKKVVVCGHTRCGGAVASLGDAELGEVLDSWLLPVRELRRKHKSELDALPDDDARAVRVAELNVRQSIEVLRQHPAIRRAAAERGLTVHGLIYDLGSGELRMLEESAKGKGNGLWSPN